MLRVVEFIRYVEEENDGFAFFAVDRTVEDLFRTWHWMDVNHPRFHGLGPTTSCGLGLDWSSQKAHPTITFIRSFMKAVIL